MNTSIPTSIGPDPAGALSPASDPTLAALLGSLPASAVPAGEAFASLLAGAPATATCTPAPAGEAFASQLTAALVAGSTSVAPAGTEGQGGVPVVLTTPGTVLTRLAGAGLRPGLLKAAAHSPVQAVASSAAPAADEDAGEVSAPSAPSREAIEQALALLAPLWNLLAPTAAAVSLPVTDAAPATLSVNLHVPGERPRTATLALPVTSEALNGAVDQLLVAPAAPAATPVAAPAAMSDVDSSLPEPSAPAPIATTDAAASDPMPPSTLPSTPVVPTVSTAAVPTPAPSAAPRAPVMEQLTVATPARAVTVNTAPASGAEAGHEPGDESPESIPVHPARGVEMRLPGGASLTIAVRTPVQAGQGQGEAGQKDDRQEKYAGLIAPAGELNRFAASGVEKQFLSPQKEQVSAASAPAGISGAEKADAMPQLANNPRRFTSSSMPEPVPVRSALVEFLPAAPASAPAQAPAAQVAAPESVAHRAVEAVMALVDSQRAQPAQGGLVNLSFKIGHDDLTVRVQLRDGVLQAQFRTDSPELRAALATEWRTADPAAAVGNLRVAEPEFVPASASTGSFAQNGFAQGQSHSQQQQAQASPSLLFPELRGLRRGATAAAETPESRPAAVYAPHALHLTAVA